MDAKDFNPYILALKDADVVVCYLPGIAAIQFYQSWASLGGKKPILETPGDTTISAVMQVIGDNAVGSRGVATYGNYVNTPGNKEFVSAYQQRWKEPPSHIEGSAYRDIEIAVEALKATNGDTSGEALAKPSDQYQLIGFGVA